MRIIGMRDIPTWACLRCDAAGRTRMLVRPAERPVDAHRAEFTRTCRGCGTRWHITAERFGYAAGVYTYDVSIHAVPRAATRKAHGRKNSAAET